MATDLNLHRKTAVISQDTQEGKARDIEVRNRERTWILCFCLDRSFSAHMGKPSSIKEEYVHDVSFWPVINPRASYIIRHAHEWHMSPMANPWDSAVSAYAVCIFLFHSCKFVSSCYIILRNFNGYCQEV